MERHFLCSQVMTAASYWSLLAPAIELASKSGYYGANGEYTFAPIAVGFALGAGFVYAADELLSRLVSDPLSTVLVYTTYVPCFTGSTGHPC